ncbi:MAG TPA: lytic transglycosylase domain-containing protein [bacterium]|nr:lytic transglycosylase domain-containing protein [bacterium]
MTKWARTLLLVAGLAVVLGWKATLSYRDHGAARAEAGAAGCASEPGDDDRPAEILTRVDNADEPLMLVPASVLAGASLPSPGGIEGRIRLWEAVFGEYDNNYIIIFNRERPGVIYDAIFDLPGRKQAVITRLRPMLKTLDQISRKSADPLAEINERPDGPELAALYQKFAYLHNPEKFARAALPGHIGSLRGRKNELIQAYQLAAPYLPVMEEMFRDQGLPPDLTRLVFVESMFDRRARSSAGAVGVWQFLPSAARPYLVMTTAIDERRDPIAATRAAAYILKRDHQRLKTWPLAVTAYNAGTARMIKAMNRTGADSLAQLINEYDYRDIGFSVENFYAKLIAVIRVEKKLGLKNQLSPVAATPLDYDLVSLPRAYTLNQLSRELGMSTTILVSMNPAWTDAVENSWTAAPKGYLLRVPKGSIELVKATLGIIDTAPLPGGVTAGSPPALIPTSSVLEVRGTDLK